MASPLRWKCGARALLAALLAGSLAAAPAPTTAPSPTTRPAPTTRPQAPIDPATAWLLGHATTAPAEPLAPAATGAGDVPAKPASPFKAAGGQAEDGARYAVLTLSNGEKIRGNFTTTAGKPWRIYDEHEVFRDIPFNLIAAADAKVLWERDEREWHFKQSGSDVKEYTGKTYPARDLQYTLTLVNGQTVTGAIVAPLYLQGPAGENTFILHKRDKGEPGQSLKDLVYVSRVDFTPAPK